MTRNSTALPPFRVRHPDLVTFLEERAKCADEQAANQRGRRTPAQSRAIEEHVRAHLRPGPTQRILDVGCGTGLLTRAYARDAGHVVAIDVSTGLIARARANLAGYPNVATVRADAVQLPFGNHVFDQILFCNVVPYCTRDELYAILREMKRVCKPGGSILVCDLSDPRRELSTILIYGGPTAPLSLFAYMARRVHGRTRRGWYHPREFADMARAQGLEPEILRQARRMPFQHWRYDCRLIVPADASPRAG